MPENMTPEQRLKALGLALPGYRGPSGNYVPLRQDGAVLYLAGQGLRREDGTYITGKVGQDIDAQAAYEHARLCALGLLSVAATVAGRLGRLEVLKVFGMVNAVPEFRDHPKVINGCSDLLVAVLGERGRHARSAVGMGSLPNGIPVEVEAVMRIMD
jgi:enamine deaminase RidA (YjgF/YER057c/UK114 family)